MCAVCVQTAMHEVFEEEDMRQLFRWLTKFLNNPYSEDDQLVPAGKPVHGQALPDIKYRDETQHVFPCHQV